MGAGKVRLKPPTITKTSAFSLGNMGMQIELPRPDVWEGIAKTGVILGVGDGSNKTFAIPNREPKDVTIYVDDVAQTEGVDWDLDIFGNVEFDIAPASALSVTADYFCPYIPKDSDHVLDVTFRLNFDIDEPSPVVTPPDYSGLPGASVPVAGTSTGFFSD